MVQEKWAADGSGSIFLLGYMDSMFRSEADPLSQDISLSDHQTLNILSNSCCLKETHLTQTPPSITARKWI